MGGCKHSPPYFFKVAAPGLNVQVLKLEKAVLEAVIDEAHRQGLKATVHTVDEEAVIEALEAGADGLEHGVVEHKLKDDRVVGANSKGEPKATADAISEQLKIRFQSLQWRRIRG
jgi:imidazolonepropionase-like amidohydrolase